MITCDGAGASPAAMAVRLVIVVALSPEADIPEVICRIAGLLELLPSARPWHGPGTEALTRCRDTMPAELFEILSACSPPRSRPRAGRG